MVAGKIKKAVVAERVLWINQMIDGLTDLRLHDRDVFLQNRHHVAAAESYLRRALEALFDLGRHILAKGFAYPATEYKEIATGLSEKGVFSKNESDLMRKMAGYRNRMTHFYHEITPDELFDICRHNVGDIKLLLEKMILWVNEHNGND
jgi:uncharacterized protein YutE (UPF0331/DUF86 family)